MADETNDMLSEILEEQPQRTAVEMRATAKPKPAGASTSPWREKYAETIENIGRSQQLTEADFSIRINTTS